MRNSEKRLLWVIPLLFLMTAPAIADPPTPPPQPASGPGGTDYLHRAVVTNGPYWAAGHEGQSRYQYYTYEPADPSPQDAPVVLFLHGWKGLQPRSYGAWIEHIVRKGYTVVWVQYQDSALTLPWLFAGYALAAWKDSLNRLDTEPDHVRPSRDYKGHYNTAMVGHSAGGYLSMVLAAMSVDSANGIPRPYAVVAVEPGGLGIIPKANFSKIDDATYIVLVVGNHDDVACKSTAVYLWNEIIRVRDANKDFLLVRSDEHGSPSLTAGHYFPPTMGFTADATGLDALDFFVTFKLSVAAPNCAFKRQDCEYAVGHGRSEQVDMGTWSDGRAVAPMVWVEDPDTLATACEDPVPFGCGSASASPN